MNRSILIVIVDFLLVSLLAFSRLDDPNILKEQSQQAAMPTRLGSSGPRQDMVDILKVSLDKERESREQLNEQLRQIQAQLQSRDEVLGDREKLMREAEQLLRQKADEASRLAEERAALQRQFATTQGSVAELQKQLTNTLTEASRSRQHLEAVKNDLQAREEEESILKRKLAELERVRQEAEAERLKAEAERQQLAAQLQSVKEDVQVERQEKAKLQEHATKLAEGVSVLAEKSGEISRGVTALTERSGEISRGVTTLTEKSGEISRGVTTLTEKSGEISQGVTNLAEKSKELTKEIRDYRPLAPNSVFNEFVTNRVRGDFRAVRSGVFGREVNREKEGKSILMRQGNQIFALYHVNDTPLSFASPGTDWDWLIGNLRHGNTVARMERISFLAVDPRVVVIPVSEAKARELGVKVYSVPKDPYRFQDAILVGANEAYYGECKFQIDPENPQYIRMQRERFSWLVGKFQPSSGDLVFTKGGELLGLMVNKDYCLLLHEFSPAYTMQTGIGITDQQTGVLLSQMFSQVSRMPSRLQ